MLFFFVNKLHTQITMRNSDGVGVVLFFSRERAAHADYTQITMRNSDGVGVVLFFPVSELHTPITMNAAA